MPVLLIALCLGLPVLEIWVAIEVAGQIGVLPTLGALILLSLAGGWLLRYESTRAWRSFTEAVANQKAPQRAAGGGALSVLGSVLLVIPGFVTAAFGLVCLFPPTRMLLRGLAVRLLMPQALRRVNLPQQPIRVRATRGHPVIDGELDSHPDGPTDRDSNE
jgi:UPF0716 protein FxsA